MRALCVGECMVELRAIDDSTMRVGYAGDTYNTAVYLRRAADHLNVDIDVGYLTGLGTDEFSTEMRAAWAREGVADRSIALADKLPGLYTVRIDEHGERRFSYWRSASAARHLFAGTGWVAHLRDADVLHLGKSFACRSRKLLVHRFDRDHAADELTELALTAPPLGHDHDRNRDRHRVTCRDIDHFAHAMTASFECNERARVEGQPRHCLRISSASVSVASSLGSSCARNSRRASI